MTSKTARLTAFSLLELMVSIVIICILMLVALPAQWHFREKSKGAACVNNLRQIGAATMQFAGENNGELPYYWYPVGNDSGSGEMTGTWYYNLAPYLNVPRTEVAGGSASEERTLLGTSANPISAPCVFTCPSHKKTESDLYWKPNPMRWPTRRPVSYAPSLEIRGDRTGRSPVTVRAAVGYYPVRLNDIKALGQKIWISDSPLPTVLNCINDRWKAEYSANWPRQGFTRHSNGGNALFYDGHVMWLPLTTFTATPDNNIDRVVNLYFNPYREPQQDH